MPRESKLKDLSRWCEGSSGRGTGSGVCVGIDGAWVMAQGVGMKRRRGTAAALKPKGIGAGSRVQTNEASLTFTFYTSRETLISIPAHQKLPNYTRKKAKEKQNLKSIITHPAATVTAAVSPSPPTKTHKKKHLRERAIPLFTDHHHPHRGTKSRKPQHTWSWNKA